jgi:hypothetical protein
LYSSQPSTIAVTTPREKPVTGAAVDPAAWTADQRI